MQATYIEGMTPHIGIAADISVAPKTTATLVSVTGSGILVGTTIRGSSSLLGYKLIIDGTTYFINAAHTAGNNETITYIHMLPFNSSFITQIYNDSETTTNSVIFIAASYLLH